MIGYIPLYDKYGDDAKVIAYRKVDSDKWWNYMMTHLPPGHEDEAKKRLCAEEEDDDGHVYR